MPGAPKTILKQLLLLVLALPVLSFHVFAEIEELQEVEGIDHAGDIEEWQFKEEVVKIPGYPEASSLMKLDIDAGDSPFEYFIDAKSLSIGRDEIVLYTIVVQSRSGYQNILFEGMRCDTREYKTYAYGTGKKTFYKIESPRWKNIGGRTGTGLDYRRDLVTMYYCSENGMTLDKDEIMSRIHDPDNIPVDNRFD